MAGFMTLEVWEEPGVDVWRDGSEQFVPVSYADPDEAISVKRPSWWAMYSAHGYMDRTDPVSGETALEALEECWRLYGDEENEDEVAEYNDLRAQVE